MSIKKNYDSAGVTAANVNTWTRFKQSNDRRIGVMVQNQNATARFWVCDHAPSRTESAACIEPKTGLIEDILPDQGDVWVMGDTVGAYLTVIETFNN